jgi:ACT domain-containing protein
MTDRYKAFLVTLDSDLHSDDAEPTIAAIRQIKGVIDVAPVMAEIDKDYIARMRVREEIWESLRKLLWPEPGKPRPR